MTFLYCSQGAFAASGFPTLSVTPTSGTVDNSGTLQVLFNGTVQPDASDAVVFVTVNEGDKILATAGYQVSYNKLDIPRSVTQSIYLNAALGPGTHQLHLEVSTVNNGFNSQTFTITVRAADGSVPAPTSPAPTPVPTPTPAPAPTPAPTTPDPGSPGFQGVTVSPMEGTVATGSTLYVSFGGTVAATDASDAVSSVSILEGATVLKYFPYQVGYNKLGDPVNVKQTIAIGAALPAGIHTLHLEAATVNGGFNSQAFTITIKAPDGSIPGVTPVTPAVNTKALMAAISMLMDDDAPVVPPVPPPPPVPSTIQLGTPASGITATPGSVVTFPITVGGPNTASVKVYANDVLVGAASGNGQDWVFDWGATGTGIYSFVAKSNNSAGSVLAVSSPVSITLGGSSSLGGQPSSSEPRAVNITLPTFGNGEAGTLPGTLGVGSDGAASYSIDLVVPPGTANMQPKLALNYSSNGSNGMVGLGWSLGGLSTIHRCNKTIAQDGYPGRIAFDTGDRLCLDGMRLMRFDGTSTSDEAYWQTPNGAQYRTEIEGFSRITRQANGGFKVELKDGRIQYYGTDSNTAIAAQGRTDSQPLLWALARTEDRSGNYMTYEYSVDSATGEYLPTQIRYGGNTNANQVPDLAVRFQQDTRADSQIQYMGGSRNDLRTRLTHVRTYVNTSSDGTGGTLARDYTIGYVQSGNSGRSLVDYVQVCGDDGKCLPKTKIGWGQNSATMVQKYAFVNYVMGDDDISPYKVVSGDFDGSGKTSFLYPIIGAKPCPRCVGKQIQPLTGVLYGIRTESDHATDIQAVLSFPPGDKYSEITSGDLNGDGRDDLIVVDVKSRKWAYCLATEVPDGTVGFGACQVGGVLPAARADAPREGDIPSVISLRNNGKSQLITVDGTKNVYVCSFDNNAMGCTLSPTVIPSDAGTFDLLPVSLSRQGMTDFYTATLSGGGLIMCNYLSEKLTCKKIPGLLGGWDATPADMNGDGLTDLFYGNYGCLSSEISVDCKQFGTTQSTGLSFIADFLGNGVNGFWGAGTYPIADSLCYLANGGTACHKVDVSKLPNDNFDRLYGESSSTPVHIDASGVTAIFNCSSPWYENNHFTQHCRVFSAALPANEDRITNVVNGMGQREEIDYARGDDSTVYNRYATVDGAVRIPLYPQRSAVPDPLVKYLRKSNGQSGWIASSYSYAGLMYDANGRGSLGFTKTSSTDANGIATDATFSQTFPYIGMATHVSKRNSSCTFEDTSNTLEATASNMTAGGQNYFVDVKQSDSNQNVDCVDARTVSTANAYTDSWGNLNTQTVTVTGNAESFVTQTKSSFNTSSAQNFLSGLPTSVSVTKKDSAGNTLTRTTGFAYEATGLIKSQTVEPDDSTLKVTTTFGRENNVYGLVNKQTQTWTNPACADNTWMALKANSCNTAMSIVISDTAYDTKGRFATNVKNALGQSESRTYDAKSGLPTSHVDVNQLTSYSTVDTLGRVTVEKSPDQNEKRSNLRSCGSSCPNGAVVAQVVEFFHGATRIAPSQVSYLDSAAHTVQSMTWGFDGARIVSEQRYDSLGRLFEQDWPRFDSEPKYLAKRFGYDDFNRITSTISVDTDGSEKGSTTEYQGGTIKQTNFNNQLRTETHNAIDQIVKVEDSNYPVRGITKYEYEPFGSLNKTTDPNGNVISIAYDRLGRRTKLTDPDLGAISYGVNAIGQVWSQESPNHRASGKKTYTEFDLLGRMIGRYEKELESHWIFDTAVMGIGQLAEAYTMAGAVKDYSRVHSYDGLGRPSETKQKLMDGWYRSRIDYDEWSRPVTSTYQRGTDVQKIFSTRYNGAGYLARIERGALVLWSATKQDASNRPYVMTLGSGLVQSKYFNVHTGRLDSANVKNGSIARLQEAYNYDPVGNVTNRSQYWDAGGFSEGLHYDALNRIDTSNIGGVEMTYSYDLAGNIKSKAGTGTYVYPAQGSNAIRPHAVSTVTAANGATASFYYDDNGNLKDGTAYSATWTSFDMPSHLAKNNIWAEFKYGPEHQRTSQNRNDQSTVIYAGEQEVETRSGVTTVKTYWPNGLGVEIDRGTSATELNWSHLDRLGSPIALTTETGTIRERLEYDVWGKRRSVDDNNSIADNVDGKIDSVGFTGHEMLDQLDLIHMNGRIYSPLTARFLSADPFVADLVDGQSYNRYSYVGNNPTNFTDPSGFIPETVTGTMIAGGSVGGMNVDCAGTCTGFKFMDPADFSGTPAPTAPVGNSAGNRTGATNGNANNEGINNPGRPESSENYSPPGKGFFTPHYDLDDYPGKNIVQVVVTAKKLASDISDLAIGDQKAAISSFRENWFAYFGIAMQLRGMKSAPTSKLPRYEGPKPAYHVNPAHVRGQRGFNPTKTPLPGDAESVFSKSVPNDPSKPTAWFGRNSDGQIYRFSSSNDGTAHFSGIERVGDGVRNLTQYAVDRLNGN